MNEKDKKLLDMAKAIDDMNQNIKNVWDSILILQDDINHERNERKKLER